MRNFIFFNSTSANKRSLAMKLGLFIGMTAILFSCLHLRAVYYPEVVETNSTFEVKMVADMNNPLDDGITERFGYGFIGVLLPVGWTIDEENVLYDYIGKDDEFDNEFVQGKLLFNEEMTDYCEVLDNELWGDEYYWQGFRTDNRLHSNNMDSVVITFNVTTDDQVGDYMMLVGIQETSYDKWDGAEEGEEGNSLLDNKPDGPFYDIEESDEFSKEYLSIKVEQSTGVEGVKYSKKDKNNYSVLSPSTGKVLVRLHQDLKLGAMSVVYDVNGKELLRQTLTQKETELNISLDSGVYFVAVQKDGVRSSKKVLVK